MRTISEILSDTLACGFDFVMSPLRKKEGASYIQLPNAPLLTVTDFALFEANFPGVLLKHSNGQSVKVHGQGICRNALWNDRSISPDVLRRMQIESICFGKTQASASVRTVEIAMTSAQQAQFLAEMADMGVDNARDILSRILSAK